VIKSRPHEPGQPAQRGTARGGPERIVAAGRPTPSAIAQRAARDPHALTPAEVMQLQRMIANAGVGALLAQSPPRANRAGLADELKAGVERLSGLAMDDVRVHYNSDRPGRVHALADTQGADIHIAAGQEQHLPHEARRVVQQKQRRVAPTLHIDGVAISDDQRLEQEAQTMGRMASHTASLPLAPVSQLAATTSTMRPAVPVVQRKLKTGFGGAAITNPHDLQRIPSQRIINKDRPSDGVKDLIASTESFYLPDTLDVDLAADQIRVLEEKKYLLGEGHYSAAWEKRIALWSYVPKMSEAYSEIYSEDPTARGALAQQTAPPLIPLEETLTKAVSNALSATRDEQLCENWSGIPGARRKDH
jgi:hypothetical protein